VNESAVLKIAGAFSLLSALAMLTAIPIAAGLQGFGGPGPINFGSGMVLSQLAATAPRPAWVDTLALLGPVLGLPAGAGWYLISRQHTLATLGILLWYLGMVFTIMQDAVQIALVVTFPAAYVAADPVIQPALEIVGSSASSLIVIVSRVGAIGWLGCLFVSLSMVKIPRIPKWMSYLGIAASAVALVSVYGQALFPKVALFGIGVPVGIMTFIVVWVPAIGIVMLNWKNDDSRVAAA
jgi:hypothetical protein